MANNIARQLLIGLDAMEWNLVERWAAEGKLPTFQRLLKEGLHGELKTTAAQLPDTVWASICTGANPGKLEKYFYAQYDPSSGNLKTVPDDAIHGVPFWEYLSEAGKRISIVDVPKFPLSRRINGLHLTNWGAHATKTCTRLITRVFTWRNRRIIRASSRWRLLTRSMRSRRLYGTCDDEL